MDIAEALEMLDILMIQVKNEEDIDDITKIMLRMAWSTFVRLIYKNGYMIVDRHVDEEYVKGKTKASS